MRDKTCTSKRRVDLLAILADPAQRRDLMVDALIATQAREGIETTREEAEAAYDKVMREKTVVEMRTERDSLNTTINRLRDELDRCQEEGLNS